MTFSVVSDHRHTVPGAGDVDMSTGVPQPLDTPPATFEVIGGPYDTLEDAEARYQEALADDVNDRVMLLDDEAHETLRQNFDGGARLDHEDDERARTEAEAPSLDSGGGGHGDPDKPK